LGPELGQRRSVRSSSFEDSTDFALAAHRFLASLPDAHLPDLGFRCVIEDPTFYAPYCKTSMLYGSDGNGNPTDAQVQYSDGCIQPGFDYDPDCELQLTRIEVLPPNLPADYQIVVSPPDACTTDGSQKFTCDGTGQTARIDYGYPRCVHRKWLIPKRGSVSRPMQKDRIRKTKMDELHWPGSWCELHGRFLLTTPYRNAVWLRIRSNPDNSLYTRV